MRFLKITLGYAIVNLHEKKSMCKLSLYSSHDFTLLKMVTF